MRTVISMVTGSQGPREVHSPQPPSVTHRVHHSQAEILGEEASVPKQPCPQLDTNDAKDEKDEETEQQDIAQHRQGVQQ